ncbi:MAG: GspH/FimT family pseudopilin [Robiginitomaculum sp.]
MAKTRSHKPCAQSGFTLIEVLSVLVIIGLMSSAVIMSMPREKPAAIVQGDWLLTALNRAAQSSIISGKPTGFGVSTDAYALYKFEDEHWAIVQEGQWPDALNVKFKKQGQEIKLGETLAPSIVFDPTGVSTIFSLSLSDGQARKTLSSIGDGRIVYGAAP